MQKITNISDFQEAITSLIGKCDIDQIQDEFKNKIQKTLDEKDKKDVVLSSLLHRFKSLSQDSEDMHFWDSLLDNHPEFARKVMPVHHPDPLLIMAWTADIEFNSSRGLKIGNVKWGNKSLISFLRKNAVNSDLYNKFTSGDLSLQDFFKNLAIDETTGEYLDKFIDSLISSFDHYMKNVDKKRIDKKVKTSGPYQQDTIHSWESPIDRQKVGIDIFRLVSNPYSEDQVHIILGAKLYSISGIGFNVKEDLLSKDKNYGKWYDLFAVFHLKPTQNDEKFTEDHLLAVQGIFVPVTARKNLYDQWKEMAINAKSAGMVARNFSHNLGSHAMLKIDSDLRKDIERISQEISQIKNFSENKLTQKFKEQGRRLKGLADFMVYITERAELVALLATNNIPSYSTPIYLQDILDQFNEQGLLRNNLCSTEGFELKKVESAENPIHSAAISISMPGGKLGVQALYALLENFARNSAKHSSAKRPSNAIDLKMKIQEVGHLYKIDLWDNEASYGNGPDEETREAIKSDIDKLNRIVEQNNNVIKFDKENSNSFSLGLMEMQIWVAFLRQINLIESIELGLDEPKILEYQLIESDRPHLGLVFYMHKGEWAEHDNLKDKSRLTSKRTHYTVYNLNNDNGNEKKLKPGRWIAYTSGSEYRFFSCFNKALRKDRSLINITNNIDNQVKLALISQRFILSDLKNKSLKGLSNKAAGIAKPSLFIIEKDWAQNNYLEYEFEEFNAFIINEKYTQQPAFSRLIDSITSNNGVIAIWARHASLIEIFEQDTPWLNRVIHYECYNAPLNPYFKGYESNYGSLIQSIFLEKKSHTESEFKNLLELQLGFFAEAALSKTLIVDDRLSKHFADQKDLVKQMQRAGIYFLDPDKHTDWPNKLDEIFNDLTLPAHGKMPFIFESFHASLKKKKYTLKNYSGKTEDEKWGKFLRYRQSQVPFFSLHSGRGAVSGLGDLNSLAFFPVTVIRKSAFEKPCKFDLVQVLVNGGISSYGNISI